MNSSVEEEIEEELEDETVESEKEEESEEEVESEDESEEVEEEESEDEEEESEDEEDESEVEESESVQEQTTESEAEPAKKPESNKPKSAPKESLSTLAVPEASDKDDNPYIDDSFEDFSDLDSSVDKVNSKKTESGSKPLKSSTAAPSTLSITSNKVPPQSPLTANNTSAPKIVHNESSTLSSTSNQIQPSQTTSTVASSLPTSQSQPSNETSKPPRTADFKGEGMGMMYSKGSFTWIDPEMEIQHSNHSTLHKFFSAENEQLYSELVEAIEENERKAMEERWLNREVDVSHEVKDMFSTVNRTDQVTDEVVQSLVVSALIKQLQHGDPKPFRDTVASQSDSVHVTQNQQTLLPSSQPQQRVHSTRSKRNKSTVVEDKFQHVLEEMGKKKELPAIGNIARIIRKETPGTDAVTDTVINSLIKEALNEILQDEMIVSIIKDAVKLKLKKILKII